MGAGMVRYPYQEIRGRLRANVVLSCLRWNDCIHYTPEIQVTTVLGTGSHGVEISH